MSATPTQPFDLTRLDDDAFERLYKERVEPCFAAHEPERLRAVKSFWRRLGITLPIAVALAVAIGVWSHEFIVAAIFALVFASFAWGISYWNMQVVADKVKAASLTAIAESVGIAFSPAAPDPPALTRFGALGLLPSYDRGKFEDLFHGAYHDAAFDLYEGRLERRSRDSKGRDTYSTVFRGQLVRLAFPRRFLGVTVVRRDAGFFNLFGEDHGQNLKRVGLEDPQFEKVFEVYGTDQVEARYLVHPVFMQRLLDLEQSLKGKALRCGFEEGDLLIAIEGGNLFEPGDMFKPLADRQRARRLVDEIGGVMRVMEAVLTAQATRAAPKT